MNDTLFLATTAAVFIGASVDDYLLMVALFGSTRNPIMVATAKLFSTFVYLVFALMLGHSLLALCPVPSVVTGVMLLVLGLMKLFKRRQPLVFADSPGAIWLPVFVSGLDNGLAYAALFTGFTPLQSLVSASAIMSMTAALGLSAFLASKLFSADKFRSLDWAALLLVGIGIYNIVK